MTTERIAVVSRATRKEAWRAFLDHLESGRLDGYDRVILQHDQVRIAYVDLAVPNQDR